MFAVISLVRVRPTIRFIFISQNVVMLSFCLALVVATVAMISSRVL